MVNSTSTSKSNRFSSLEQAPGSSQVKPRPRHPYAFCQYEEDDYVEYLRAQVRSLKKELQAKDEEIQEKNEALEVARAIAINALSRNSIKREEIETLAHIDEPDLSNN